MTGTAISKGWRGLANLMTAGDVYCCAVNYLYSLNIVDGNAKFEDCREEYIDFLASQIKAKTVRSPYGYAYFAHVPNSYNAVIHEAFIKAGWSPMSIGPDKHNAYWNFSHGPNAIHTYIFCQEGQSTISKPGDKLRAYKSPIPPKLLTSTPPKEVEAVIAPLPPLPEPVIIPEPQPVTAHYPWPWGERLAPVSIPAKKRAAVTKKNVAGVGIKKLVRKKKVA